MKKGNLATANFGEPIPRITRARAAACQQSGGIYPSKATKKQDENRFSTKQQDQKRVLRTNSKRAALDVVNNSAPVTSGVQNKRRAVLKDVTNSKRAALDEVNSSAPVTAGVQNKRRAVLKDVTNVFCDSYRNCLMAPKVPIVAELYGIMDVYDTGFRVCVFHNLTSVTYADCQKNDSKQTRKGSVNVSKVAPSVAVAMQKLPADLKLKAAQLILNTEVKSSEGECPVVWESKITLQRGITVQGCYDNPQTGKENTVPSQAQKFSKRDKVGLGGKLESINPDIIDIDSDHKESQLCSLYAPDIYSSLRVAELMRRAQTNFMEEVQRDITQSMRGILIDWLVEVSEEYKLAADTLYLTVHFIDLFLSQNYIERQRLQLLGITCMLIASLSSNWQVLKMESQVLNYLAFQLSSPTAKSFLRRFLRAAQASYKTPSLELEFLANYLAELTLVEYEFLKFIPSIIAASAVFLARWTLDQSSHPWNATLEHYTNYKASDLKTAVQALQCLQLNTDGCPLNAIRSKYRQDKYKSVAALTSPELLQTLFYGQNG
ncbi:hypothetical protein RHGRI_024910 [Rhododendron griersonianum]|uniref:Cyclin A2 n=1 Tax=Rhododendron griersonianum TaxID=479676 RepID=A0AAV6JGA9_9ERIC|nr:hypothetical protein RHGRI_024910 [Rhododendron griersonianum]